MGHHPGKINEPMLLTKLHIPSPGDQTVHREDLFDKLNCGLNRKLILISAPAGFGKTTLVCDWIHQQKIPAAWFSIDKGDNDPEEFLSYIISGIQGVRKEFGQSALRLLQSPNKPSPEAIATLLINDILRIKHDFILVLDDFHHVSSREVVELINFILQYIPGNIHLVILTRSDPALPLARIRSQHQMVELRLADLSFTAHDISALFNKKLKLGLSNEDVYLLESRTEGWIAGLQLAALSVQQRRDVSEFIRDLQGENQYIMDYLMEEVLKTQPDDIREFLLKTSLLDQMNASLCDWVLNRNDSRFIIEHLERNNMFVIPLDSERNWYRYHHLFSDLLKQRFQQQMITNAADIRTKACDWFEQHQMTDLAIENALAGQNYEKSLQLISKVVEEMWCNGKHAAILRYGAILPEEWIQRNADFCFYYAWVLITSGQIGHAEPYLACADWMVNEKLKSRDIALKEAQGYKKLSGKIAVAYTYLKSHDTHSEKIFAYSKRAMEYLPEDDPQWFSWAWFSEGIAWYSKGDLERSNAAFLKAFDFAKKSGNIYLISTTAIRMAENEQQLGHYRSAYKKCMELLTLLKARGYSQITKADWTFASLYYILGTSYFMWAENDKAFDNIKIAYDLCKSGKDSLLKAMILMVYSVILRDRGEAEAERRIAELDEIMNIEKLPPFMNAYYMGWKIFMFLDKNQMDKARDAASGFGLDLDQEKTFANEAAYSSYLRLLLAQNQLDEAELLLSAFCPLAIAGNRAERIIDLKTAHAILYKKRGEYEKAVAVLAEAMALAAEENLLSFFVFNNDPIDALIKKIFNAGTSASPHIPKKFISNLKLALERKDNRKKGLAESALSARELEMMKLMAEDLMNQEMADRLFVSLNTVKTHLKNIFIKLGVDSRSRAVAKAKEMGLI